MKYVGLILLAVCSLSCSRFKKERVELIVHNANIFTLDPVMSKAQAMAIRNDSIVAIGAEHEILNAYQSANMLDLRKEFVYPGFIDGHAHFVNYCITQQEVNLIGTASWEACMALLKDATPNRGEWILGRGWDQNDWQNQHMPSNEMLDSIFPSNPVLLKRIDGHAAVANTKALELAGITKTTNVEGGAILISNGKLTGVLVDNAVDLVTNHIPKPTREQKIEALISGEKKLFDLGLTTVCDAGLDVSDILLLDSLQQKGILAMNVYAMVSDNPNNIEYFQKHGAISTDKLTVRSFKSYGDGALGSRGAALLEPYDDAPDSKGFLLSEPAHFENMAQTMDRLGFQWNVHCIGDSANRLILDIMGKQLKGTNDKRWRIEHAQIVHPNDVEKFRRYTIIPSVQPTHATSDMYWASDRLGEKRMKNAYSFNRLKAQNNLICLGTDFPVEHPNPLFTFFSAITLKDTAGFRHPSIDSTQALSSLEALKGITIWPAISQFEDSIKGSLEVGKKANFTVVNRSLLNQESTIHNTHVSHTCINGKVILVN